MNTEYEGETQSKLDHLAVRPMNELIDLGPDTAHTNFQLAGDRAGLF